MRFFYYFRHLDESTTFRNNFFLLLQNGSNIYSLDISLSFNFYHSQDTHQYSAEIGPFLISLAFNPRQTIWFCVSFKPCSFCRVKLALLNKCMQATTWLGRSIEFKQGSCNLILSLFSLAVLNRFHNLIISQPIDVTGFVSGTLYYH